MNRPGTYVALLRGVNVGGARRVAMADLRELVESLGHQRVRTYIQSGNVIFSTDGDGVALDETALALGIRRRIGDRLGLDVDVMVRSRRDLEAILGGVPFTDADPKRVIIAFLSVLSPSQMKCVGTTTGRSRVGAPGTMKSPKSWVLRKSRHSASVSGSSCL